VPPKDLPFVSVIIPHQGDDAGLIQCLSALRVQTYPSSAFEVIVVRNEPRDRPAPLKLRNNERFLWEPQGFSYAARNLGVAHARGDVVAFTDSDTVPDVAWLSQGVECLNIGSNLCAGRIELTFTSAVLSSPASYEKVYSFDQRKNARHGKSATANLFVRKEVLVARGEFPQTATTGADFEWTKGATQAGFILSYCVAAIVFHPARESWSSLLAKTKRKAQTSSVKASGAPDMAYLFSRMMFRYLTPPSPEKWKSANFQERFRAMGMNVLLLGVTFFFTIRHYFRNVRSSTHPS
jgi:cellulose synthase/poly-beta-1,6-N-acetylglucosamine synthase-like glycosyltransferase